MTNAIRKLLESAVCAEHGIPLIISEDSQGLVKLLCANCANICRHCRRPLPSECDVLGFGSRTYLPEYGVEYCENCAVFCDPEEAAMYAACREMEEADEKKELEEEEAREKRREEYQAAKRAKRDAAKARSIENRAKAAVTAEAAARELEKRSGISHRIILTSLDDFETAWRLAVKNTHSDVPGRNKDHYREVIAAKEVLQAYYDQKAKGAS
jgi:hypothetical protein